LCFVYWTKQLAVILRRHIEHITQGLKTFDKSFRALPPCPVKGTGYHRFVFCLLNQTTRCDFEETHRTYI
jgi:phosphatidylethanolamine-binding protein (PEBP) family uncharacterized protein